MKAEKIVFFGTPDFAVPALKKLVQTGRKIELVVTQPDQPSGRGKKMTSPPIKVFCDQNSIPCVQPFSIKTKSFHDQLQKIQPDLFVVAAYGKLFPESLLNMIPLTLNIHASLLPRWRGASPIAQSILHGDPKTGISMMKIVKELDAGPVMLQKEINIALDDDIHSLTQKLADLGGEALEEALQLLEKDQHQFQEQDERQVTFAPILRTEDAQIQWNQKAVQIQRQIRAFSPNAFTSDGVERIKIAKALLTGEKTKEQPGMLRREKKKLAISCADEWLEIVQAQRPGKTQQHIVDFLNGYSKDRNQWF